MDIAGSTLQNYSIVKQVGEGGMANVYLAKHIQLGHQVALKLLKPEFAEHPNIRKRFLAEAKNLANMEHPNVIKVVDLIDAGDIVAFVMEYIDGQTLEEYIHRNKPLSNHTIEPLFSQMVEGLNYIHEKGFIHRDIKPSNFMVTSNGQIKLLDFGIAKNTNEGATDYTKTGLAQQMGTPLYMSPEQVRNTSEVTPLTDIYSLGVVLWQMVKAQKPYDSRHLTLPEIQVAIMKEPLPLTGTKWDKLIQSATQKKEEDRYLEGFSSLSKPKGSISQQNANRIPKYDNKAIIGISIIFLIIILLSIGYHFWKENAINNSPKNTAQSTEIVDPGSDPKASSGENVQKQTKIETTQTEDVKEEKRLSKLDNTNYSIITDNDGNKYRSVKIGDREWLIENLMVTHFNNGEPIKKITKKEDWIRAAKDKTPAFCFYNFSENNKELGCIYNWFAMNDSRGISPAGFKVPTVQDFEKTSEYYGGFLKSPKKMAGKNGYFGQQSYTINRNGFFSSIWPHWWTSSKIIMGPETSSYWEGGIYIYEIYLEGNQATSQMHSEDGKGDGYPIKCVR